MQKKKKFKKMVFLIIPLLIVYYVITGYFIKEIYYYNSNQSMMKNIVYIVIIACALFIVLFTIWSLICIKKNKLKNYLFFIILIILVCSIEYFATYNLNKISNSISKVTDKYTNYSTSLIAMKDSNIKDINDLKKKKIGIISDTNDTEGYVIANEIVKEENIDKKYLVEYDNYLDMLSDLFDDKISGMFVSSSYADVFSNEEGYEKLDSLVTEVKVKTKRIRKNVKTNTKSFAEPFTLLVVGVDSDTASLKKSNSFNGDTLMLMTFNPNTLNTTILSIPRDTRVPIACTPKKSKNKINASPIYGIDCVEDTITNFTGIKIDYWVKVNFQGVVDLVNAVGGIDVDVPYAFCEQDSKRRFGKNTIFVEKGMQTLNGEQALAFARNRHTWPQYCPKKYSKYVSNDFIRGQNQQTIINAIANKLKSVRKLSEIYDILDVLGDNIDTNIDKDTMVTGFDTLEKIISKSKNINSDDFIGTQKLYLSGYDNKINGIYYFEYYKQSLKEVTDAMEINLEIKKPKMDKEFSFSINSPYESTPIGKGTYSY